VSIHLLTVDLGSDVVAGFTGRDADREDPPVGAAGNLGHRRPHRPADLVADRREVAERLGVPISRWHLMHQVHGAEVGEVDVTVPPGTELRGVDAMTTACPDRALVVQVADCVPVLLAGPGGVGVVHAGRAGVAAGVVPRAVTRLGGDRGPTGIRAVIGPAIGGCCYEVPAAMRDEVAAVVPAAWARTRWGTPSLDLPAAVADQLARAGVEHVTDVGCCTLEDERYFSHRRDPGAGRQVGLVMRQEAA
jgi:polyphenol oxidase